MTDPVPPLVRDPERLAALRELELLDTPAEPGFDRLTALAARVLRAPVALVSLVDGDRQFFKSAVGLGEPWASRRETPLSHSFCQHALGRHAPLLVEDARLDPLLRHNLAIPDLGVVAYAGVPLTTGDGRPLGAFCAIDHVPRRWTDDEVEVLRGLAAMAATEIELRRRIARHLAAEAALRQSESRFRTVVESLDEGLLISDADDVVLYVNARLEEITGWSAAEMVGRRSREVLVPEEDRMAFSQRLARRRGGASERYEMRVKRRDGSYGWVEVGAVPLLDEEGRVVGTVGSTTDIGERRRAGEELHRAHEQLRALVQASPLSVVTMDAEGRVTLWNPASERIFGWTAQEVLGGPLPAVPEEDRAEHGDLCRRVLAGETITGSGVVRLRRDGTRVPVRLSVAPLAGADGVPSGVLAVMEDVSARREVERMKDEFVSIVSHELRTPLTSIRGSLGLLASGRTGPVPERGQRLLEIAIQNTDRLVRLINDILDVERMEAGLPDLAPRPVEARELMRLAAEAVAGTAEREGIEVTVLPSPERVLADPDRIVQTLVNLVSNAVKFSPAGSEVRMEAARAGSMAVFRVSDRGRGIPAEKLDSVFERFQQVDSSDARQKGGTGLGLAVCRGIVEAHGGWIRAESVPGEGSVFTFTLPLAPQEDLAPYADGTEESAAPRVLLCDPDGALGDATAAVLEGSGYRVRLARSAREALAAAAEEPPSAVLLVPGRPGLDVAAAVEGLRVHPATRDVPVVMVAPGDDAPSPALHEAADVLLRALRRAVQGEQPCCDVLLVEDDDDLARVVGEVFHGRSITWRHARTAAEAMRLANKVEFRRVVLDLGLPDGDGLEVVDWLRARDRLRDVPVLLHTARDPGEPERARLGAGPTELLVKGRASPAEFEERVAAILRRVAPLAPSGSG